MLPKEEVDWSKASKNELIVVAINKYPKGTKYQYSDAPNLGIRTSSGNLDYQSNGNVIYDCETKSLLFCNNKWAEIVEVKQPIQDEEIKVGELVEVTDHELSENVWREETMYYVGKKLNGKHVVESENGINFYFRFVRKPTKRPSLVEAEREFEEFINEWTGEAKLINYKKELTELIEKLILKNKE